MEPAVVIAIIGAVVSLATAAVAFLGVVVTGYVALAVARLKLDVREVHVAVNSERTVMTEKLELMAHKLGVADEREHAADATPAQVIVVNPESAPVPVVAPKGTKP